MQHIYYAYKLNTVDYHVAVHVPWRSTGLQVDKT